MAIYKGNTKKNPFMMWLFSSVIFIILVLILIAGFSGHSSSAPPPPATHKSGTLRDTASNDTPVETLKTLTAEVSSVEQQNQKLIEQNKLLIEQDEKALSQFKTEIMNQVQQQISTFKADNQLWMEEAKKSMEQIEKSSMGNAGDQSDNANSHLFWVNDLGSNSNNALPSKINNDNEINFSLNHHSTQNENNLLLKDDENNANKISKAQQKNIPYYTLPVNATLTGAIALQPIIGRIPIDGKVPDPYTFKVILGAKNLAANGVDIPPDIQGIVASGIAEGDMLGSCARGQITSMTFVFTDGRISTTEAKQNDYLGTIAAENGNPCVKGSFHSNAAIYLSAQAALAGIQGYGNALSQSQLSNTTSSTTGTTLSELIGNANKYAVGQGFSAAAQTASRWWDQRVQNSFDFVFVPNVDLQTGKKLQLNINLTQEIAIDYDFNKRKIFYNTEQNLFNTTNLD